MSWLIVAEVAAAFCLLFFLSKSALPKRTATSRESYIDILKGVAIIFVIAIHATSLYPSLNWINSWLWVGLGFFALASGFVLQLNYADAFDAKKYFSRMLTRLVLPYIFISIFFLIVTNTSLLEYPASLLFGRANGNYYFIPLLICLYLLFPILRKWSKILFSPITLTAVYAFSLYFWNLHYQLSLVQWNASEWSLIFFGRYLFYFVMGMYLSQFDLLNLPARVISIVLGFYIAFVVALYFIIGWRHLLLFYPVAAFLLLLILYRAMPAAWKWFAILGPQTLFIYLLHTPMIYNFGGPQLATWLSLPDWIGFLIVIVAVTLISYLLSVGLTRAIHFFQRKRTVVR